MWRQARRRAERGRILCGVACSTLLWGCASFTEPPPVPSRIAARNPLPLSLIVSEASLLQAGDDWIEMPERGFAGWAAQAIWRSGWVERVNDVDSRGQLKLELTEYQGEGPGLLSLATAFVIPGVVDHRITLELGLWVRDRVPLSCSRSFDQRTWYQTFLVLVYPFRSPGYGRYEASEALALGCLAQLLDELEKGAPTR